MARKEREHDDRHDGNNQDATRTCGKKPTSTTCTFGRERSFGPRDSEELHLSGDALERASSEVDEAEFGAPHDIANRAADQHLTGARLCTDASADMHRDASELRACRLDLAHVDAGPDLETFGSHLLSEQARARDRISGVLEHGEETITRVVDFATARSLERVSHHGSICGEQRHWRSPMVAANSVEDTISVNSTVARRRPDLLALDRMAGILCSQVRNRVLTGLRTATCCGAQVSG
jgi:hypothetical protein